MIIEGIINFFVRIFAGVLGMIPSMNFSTSGFTAVISSLRSMMEGAGYWLPIPDILIILSLYLAYQASFFLIWSINWVVRRIADIIP